MDIQPGSDLKALPATPTSSEFAFLLALLICEVGVKPGTVLPSVAQIVDQYKVRAAVAEGALDQLAAAHLALRRGGDRPMVVDCPLGLDHDHDANCTPAARLAEMTDALTHARDPELTAIAALALLVIGPAATHPQDADTTHARRRTYDPTFASLSDAAARARAAVEATRPPRSANPLARGLDNARRTLRRLSPRRPADHGTRARAHRTARHHSELTTPPKQGSHPARNLTA